MSVASYPHVKIGVKDNSIYTAVASQTLPLHKPIYMMRAEKGPVGVPVWCPSYGSAKKLFGTSTFDARSDYFSNQAYFLLQTLTMNGSFIMRVADTNAKTAEISIQVGLKDASIPQWQRDVNGRFVTELDGSKIAIDSEGKPVRYITKSIYAVTEDTTVIKNKKYYTRSGEGTEENPYVYAEVPGLTPGAAFSGGETYYEYKGEEIQYGEDSKPLMTTQATIAGTKVAWRAIVKGDEWWEERKLDDDTPETTKDGWTWYPVMTVVASNPGAWGQVFGLKFYYDPKKNTKADTLQNGAISVSISPVELIAGDTTPTPITDAYGQQITVGTVKEKVYDPVTGLDLNVATRLNNQYTGEYALPISIVLIPSNFNIVGKELMKKEVAAETRTAALKLYKDAYKITDSKEAVMTFVDDLKEKTAYDSDVAGLDDIKEEDGYMVNIFSCQSEAKIPYYASCIVTEKDPDVADEVITEDIDQKGIGVYMPGASVPVYLGGGNDGAKADADVERYIQAQIRAAGNNTQEYLIDPWRCPYNSIFDTGVSLATKKAYLDMLDVRDSLVVNLSTQVTWRLENGEYPKLNERYEDESIGAALRAYAWLMREDIENGTEACRCKIFLHCGRRTDYDFGEGWIPATLFAAKKNAEFLSKTYIWKEIKELPNSWIDCFTEMSWVASGEDTKSRCWNAGLNYAQYYDMNNLHYASVRSVYRYDTSVLSDGGVVDAICFVKEIVRRCWSTWAGSTRPADELNKLAEEDMNSKLSAMLNGKYTAAATVYQTDEDKKFGYVRHVDINFTAPGQNRVWLVTIICNREGFTPED